MARTEYENWLKTEMHVTPPELCVDTQGEYRSLALHVGLMAWKARDAEVAELRSRLDAALVACELYEKEARATGDVKESLTTGTIEFEGELVFSCDLNLNELELTFERVSPDTEQIPYGEYRVTLTPIKEGK